MATVSKTKRNKKIKKAETTGKKEMLRRNR